MRYCCCHVFLPWGGGGSDGQGATRGYDLACGLLLLTIKVYCYVFINEALACSASSKFPVVWRLKKNHNLSVEEQRES